MTSPVFSDIYLVELVVVVLVPMVVVVLVMLFWVLGFFFSFFLAIMEMRRFHDQRGFC